MRVWIPISLLHISNGLEAVGQASTTASVQGEEGPATPRRVRARRTIPHFLIIARFDMDMGAMELGQEAIAWLWDCSMHAAHGFFARIGGKEGWISFYWISYPFQHVYLGRTFLFLLLPAVIIHQSEVSSRAGPGILVWKGRISSSDVHRVKFRGLLTG